MCIIAEEAHVSSTHILTGPITNDTQLVVYDNNVSTNSVNNMMILPVPIVNDVNDINFIDLSGHSNLFSKINEIFSTYKIRLKTSYSSTNGVNTLKMIDVGSYKVTLVPHFDSFKNLDNYFGKISHDVLKVLYDHYKERFAFIVCKLRQGTVNYHPFAYTCKLNSSQLFIPTRHVHSGREEEFSHWDHTIYTFNCKIYADILDKVPLNNIPEYSKKELNDDMSNYFNYVFEGNKFYISDFYKEEIHTNFYPKKNMDITVLT